MIKNVEIGSSYSYWLMYNQDRSTEGIIYICRVGWGGGEGGWTFCTFIDKYMQIGNKRMVTIQTQRK